MESRNSSKGLRLWQRTFVVVGAVALGAGVTHAFVGRAQATPTAPQPATTAPAASAVVTPKTERPPAAQTMSKAFAATAKALRPSVVRIDVEIGAPGLANLGHQGDSDE